MDEKQNAKIESIAKQGEINGVEGLELIGGNAARDMEPALYCIAALHLARDRHHRLARASCSRSKATLKIAAA